jgi:hypothetical protein
VGIGVYDQADRTPEARKVLKKVAAEGDNA